MAIWFAANAIWWGYRAGATISRVILDHFAGQRGTTVEAAYENARRKRQFGQITRGQMDLVNFVMFNDKWRWTDPKAFALDTSAFATAGLGLMAKVGLGNRILAVLGVKSAPTAGVVIDGMIDAVGGMLTGGGPGVGDILKGALELLTDVKQTALVKAGADVVTSTVALGAALTALGGPASGPLAIPKALMAVGKVVSATLDVLGAILGLWAAVEPHLPERRPLKPAEPGRNLMREIRDAGAPRATGPSEVWLTPRTDPVDVIFPRLPAGDPRKPGRGMGGLVQQTVPFLPGVAGEAVPPGTGARVLGRARGPGPRANLWDLLKGPIPEDLKEKLWWLLLDPEGTARMIAGAGAEAAGAPGNGGDGGDGGDGRGGGGGGGMPPRFD